MYWKSKIWDELPEIMAGIVLIADQADHYKYSVEMIDFILKEIPEYLYNRSYIKKIDLSAEPSDPFHAPFVNRISSISSRIGQITDLEELDISSNIIHEIPPSANKQEGNPVMGPVKRKPTMDALASMWAKQNSGGIRKLEKTTISNILNAGNRAFNLRVADPYLAYQRQGLGFTWSFFTPKDKQDIHLHGQPSVEIYGVLDGQFVLWHKPMYERGALVWKKEVLSSGDWIEVEALNCHFGYWATKEGYGTVIKAAGAGELAGVGRIGVSGKTVCKECPVEKQCQKHPEMLPILKEYQKIFEDRDWDLIRQSVEK